MSLKGAQVHSAPETAKREGRGTEERRRGGGRGICCHGERFFKQLLIRLCCSAPLSILPPPPSLSHLCCCQPFRQEICTLRGWLWTFLLQSFYAIRHTQGWETLSSKHRERILAGKEGKPLLFTQWRSVLCFFFFLTHSSMQAVALHHDRRTKDLRKYD